MFPYFKTGFLVDEHLLFLDLMGGASAEHLNIHYNSLNSSACEQDQ